MKHFSGSYPAEDVTFLLKVIAQAELTIEEKEAFIQQGGHYSEVLTRETAPDAAYRSLFLSVLNANSSKMAQHVVALARKLVADYEATRYQPLVLVSLARAGTPVGVLVKRVLALMGIPVKHYSVSIIRDKGIDVQALDYIRARHDESRVAFIDGWTGKGIIGNELKNSVIEYNIQRDSYFPTRLYVLADVAGTAFWAATHEDYLIPTAMLNSTVSGLISRTVLNQQVGPCDFHACLYYSHLEAFDDSQRVIDSVMAHVALHLDKPSVASGAGVAEALAQYVGQLCRQGYDHLKIKPGIGEASRALLRRAPEKLIVASLEPLDVQHLCYLAQQRGVPVEEDSSLPCLVLAIVK